MLSVGGLGALAALGLTGWAAARARAEARGRRRFPTALPASRARWLGLRELVRTMAAGPADDRVAAALPEAVDAIAAAVSAGRSIHDGLASAAAAAPPRLAAELRGIVARTERGLTVSAALDRWGASTSVPGASLVAAAVGLAGSTGGDAAAALGGVAETLRERRALAREIRALSSQARLSATVIAAAPLGFAGLASATDGDTARFLFGSVGGAVCLVAGLGLDLVGWRWMGRIAASVSDG